MLTIVLFVLISFFSVNEIDAIVVGSNSAVMFALSPVFPPNDATNKLLGFTYVDQGFSLYNNSTVCAYDALISVNGKLNLNGGTLQLSKPLFADNNFDIVTTGTILGNNYGLISSRVQQMFLPTQPSVTRNSFSLVVSQARSAIVRTVDWSFDNKYVVEGNNSTVDYNLGVFSFNGNSFSLLASNNTVTNILSARWRPNSYQFAVGRASLLGINSLFVYQFDPATNSLTNTASSILASDIYSVAWSPNGNYLAVVSSAVTGSSLSVYSVDNAGNLTFITTSGSALLVAASTNALSWDSTGTYIAVGIQNNILGSELFVYSFNGTTITAITNVNVNVDVLSVAWHPLDSILAVGLNTGTTNLLRIYSFASNVLTNQTSAQLGISQAVYGVSWSADGYSLATVGLAGVGIDNIYYYDRSAITLTQLYSISLAGNGNDVRYASNNNYVLYGDSANNMSAYGFVSTVTVSEIILNNVACQFNSNVVLQCGLRVQGNCILNCSGRTFDLNTGYILVDSNSTLLIQNTVLKNINGTNVAVKDNTGVLQLRNSEWVQSNNVTFSAGSLTIINDVLFTGTGVFSYRSTATSQINAYSNWYFDSGMVFEYAPLSSNQNLILFADYTSLLYLYETTLSVSSVGLKLSKGNLSVAGDCAFIINGVSQSFGVLLGDGTSSVNDLQLKILPESGIRPTTGYLVYQNVGG